jgi:hypothetical protein
MSYRRSEKSQSELDYPDKDGPRFSPAGPPRFSEVRPCSPPGLAGVEGPPAALGRGGAADARAVGRRLPNADDPRPKDSGRGRP